MEVLFKLTRCILKTHQLLATPQRVLCIKYRKVALCTGPGTERLSIPCPGWKETLEPAWSKAWNDSMWAGFELGGNLLALAGGMSKNGFPEVSIDFTIYLFC